MTSHSTKEIVLYQSPEGGTRLEVNLYEDTVWLAQSQIAELFEVNVPAVSKHVRNILGSGELDASATVSKMERVQIEGGREVKRNHNVLLDRASVTMQSLCNSSYGDGISLGCSKQVESHRRHDSEQIPWIFKGKGKFRFKASPRSIFWAISRPRAK